MANLAELYIRLDPFEATEGEYERLGEHIHEAAIYTALQVQQASQSFGQGSWTTRKRGAGRSAVIATTASQNKSTPCRISSMKSTKECSLASAPEILVRRKWRIH
jgi:hypothetical protein